MSILHNAATWQCIVTLIVMLAATSCFAIRYRRFESLELDLTKPYISWVLMSVAITAFRITLSPCLDSDEIKWNTQANEALTAMMAGHLPDPASYSAGKAGFPFLVVGFYAASNRAPIVIVVLNLILWLALVPTLAALTYRLGLSLNLGHSIAQRAGLFSAYFIALNPFIAFWFPRILRECIVMLLLALSVLLVIELRKKATKRLICLFIFVFLILFSIRAQISFGLLAGVLLAEVAVKAGRLKDWRTRLFVLVSSSVALLIATWLLSSVVRSIDSTTLFVINEELSKADSSFAGESAVLASKNPLLLLGSNFVHVLFGPFPNELRASQVMIMAVLSNIVWLACLIFFAILLINNLPKQTITESLTNSYELILLTTLFATFILILTVPTGNYGLVVRMRLMPFVFLIPLSAVGSYQCLANAKCTRKRTDHF